MERIELYRRMVRARAVELALAELWHRGLAPGEMHLGTGEEALVAGVLAHHREGDAYAIDHRASPVMTLLGVDLRALLAECIGHPDGLCHGQGGHMHLFAPEQLAASSGIVGSAGPAAVGFAISATMLRPGSIAVAFFGDGAANQGMLLESFNLAAAWSLPVLFVCKDNGWAVLTRSATVTGGDLVSRAEGFGLRAKDVDGADPVAVFEAAGELIEHARGGKGPGFLRARVSRLDGHYLGDALVDMARHPLSGGETTRELLSGLFSRKGGPASSRARSLGRMLGLMLKAREDQQGGKHDPVARTRERLLRTHADQVAAIDEEEAEAVHAALVDLVGEVGA